MEYLVTVNARPLEESTSGQEQPVTDGDPIVKSITFTRVVEATDANAALDAAGLEDVDDLDWTPGDAEDGASPDPEAEGA